VLALFSPKACVAELEAQLLKNDAAIANKDAVVVQSPKSS
jgi:hypothetical protein